MSTRFIAIIFVCIVSITMLSTNAISQEGQIVAGAGPSTEICKLFFTEFNKLEGVSNYDFTVMESSVKHKGGILNSNKFLFGRTGRPLTEEEKALGKDQIFLGKVPIAFSKGLEVNLSQLSIENITKIFTGEITNWQEVGGPDAPILLVGREQTEALFMTMKAEYPFFKNVTFEQIFKKDHEVVKFLISPAGKHAIAFGARPNFSEFNLLTVDGFSSGVSVGLVYDLRNKDNPVVPLAKEYAASSAWKKQVDKTSMLSIN